MATGVPDVCIQTELLHAMRFHQAVNAPSRLALRTACNLHRDILRLYSGYTKNLFLDFLHLGNCQGCPEEG